MKQSKTLAIGLLVSGALLVAAALWMRPPKSGHAIGVERPRGQLLDFRGTALTAAEVVWQPAVDMKVLAGYPSSSIARFVPTLARELGIEPERISNLGRESRSGVRQREIPVRVTQSHLQQLRVWLASSEWRETPPLIRFIEVAGRRYPQRQAAANLVGFVGRDGDGLEGMERELDLILKDGQDVRLSIDIDLQHALANRMQRAMEAHGLREASAVVIELHSRRVASIMTLPSFDPASLEQRSGPHVRLRPLTHLFQAGPLLEPFFLAAALDFAADLAPDLRARFVKAEVAAGTHMVSSLGYENARQALEQADLLSPLDIGFPGVAHTHERRHGSSAEIQRDLGNGAGIAFNLVRYSASLANLIDVSASPLRLRQVSGPPTRQLHAPERETQAQLLRAALIERARRQSRDTRADFGGMWVNYRDRVDQGESVQRAAVALFAPAARPRFLLTMSFVTRAPISEHELLNIARDALAEAMYSGEAPTQTLVAGN